MTRLTIPTRTAATAFLRVNKGKFAKDRMVPLGRKASDYVREYLQKVAPMEQNQPGRNAPCGFPAKHPHRPLIPK